MKIWFPRVPERHPWKRVPVRKAPVETDSGAKGTRGNGFCWSAQLAPARRRRRRAGPRVAKVYTIGYPWKRQERFHVYPMGTRGNVKTETAQVRRGNVTNGHPWKPFHFLVPTSHRSDVETAPSGNQKGQTWERAPVETIFQGATWKSFCPSGTRGNRFDKHS